MSLYIAVEDPDLGVDVKCCGSPYGLQHSKSPVCLTDPCVDFIIAVVVVVNSLPRLVDSSTSSIGLLLISTGLFLLVVFTRKTCVFMVLPFNLVLLAVTPRSFAFCWIY